jgi:dimethylargininase
MHFSRAIVRVPGSNFAEGLTTAALGAPDYSKALAQHAEYCRALEACGLILTRLPADTAFPDSTFVEDTAVLTERGAILTRPGAPTRQGEVAGIRKTLEAVFPKLDTIQPPGTLEGGDICNADGHFFIGVSRRTNPEGARQLSEWLSQRGYTATLVDIRGIPSILHLKTGFSYLGERRLVMIPPLAEGQPFNGFQIIRTVPGEEWAANVLRINASVVIAGGYPRMESTLRAAGCAVLPVDMSEFRKMDGSLTCLSLRY